MKNSSVALTDADFIAIKFLIVGITLNTWFEKFIVVDLMIFPVVILTYMIGMINVLQVVDNA